MSILMMHVPRRLLTQIEELEGLMRDHVPSWLGFCHNDLQYGNMLLHVSSPQVGCAVESLHQGQSSCDRGQAYAGSQRYHTRSGWVGCPDGAMAVFNRRFWRVGLSGWKLGPETGLGAGRSGNCN